MGDRSQWTGEAAAAAFDLPALERVRYGDDAIARLGDEIERLGARRVMVLTTRSIATRTDLVRRVRAALSSAEVHVYEHVRAHVPEEVVHEATAIAREHACDLVVSVGGGSAVDAAKAVALAAPSSLPVGEALAVHEVHGAGAPGFRALPHIAVTTTLSAAEYTPTFTVTMTTTRAKEMFRHRTVTPTVVVLDPAAAMATPDWLWAASGARAVDHCVEWYLSRAHMPFTDGLVLHALRMLWEALPLGVGASPDPAARLQCQLAAWMSVFGSVNVLGGLSHAIGHQLGSHTGMVHGHTSSLMLPLVLEFNRSHAEGRLADLARTVGAGDTAESFIDALRTRLRELGLPSRIADATSVHVDVDAIASATMDEIATHNNPRPVRREDVVALLEQARTGW